MIEPQLTPNEPHRLQSLYDTKLLDGPLDERFERITRLAQRMLGTPIAAISLVDSGRQWFKSIQGLDIAETSREVSFCGHTIQHDEVMVVTDARLDDRFSDNPLVAGNPHIVFYAGCPVKSPDGSKIGSLCVIDRKSRDFTGEDKQILCDLAAIVEGEIRAIRHDQSLNSTLNETDTAKRLAMVDSLTRIWNKEAIVSLLDKQIQRSRSDGNGVALIIADVDYMRQINDTFKPASGDEVLRQLAKRLLSSVREVDALGRIAGEEFIAVLGPCNGLTGARVTADRMFEKATQTPFTIDAGPISIGLSVGVLFCDDASKVTSAELIQAGYDILNRAKHNGRSRVESTWFDFSPQKKSA